MREYEREFSHIIDCVPYVVWDDRDKADCFERRLRSKIYKVVHSSSCQPSLKFYIERCGWRKATLSRERSTSPMRKRRIKGRSELRVVRTVKQLKETSSEKILDAHFCLGTWEGNF